MRAQSGGDVHILCSGKTIYHASFSGPGTTFQQNIPLHLDRKDVFRTVDGGVDTEAFLEGMQKKLPLQVECIVHKAQTFLIQTAIAICFNICPITARWLAKWRTALL